jgi:hypothetical protein
LQRIPWHPKFFELTIRIRRAIRPSEKRRRHLGMIWPLYDRNLRLSVDGFLVLAVFLNFKILSRSLATSASVARLASPSASAAAEHFA